MLHQYCPRLQYDRQLYCFARACKSGQLFFAQKLIQSYPLIVQCAQKKQIYIEIWDMPQGMPHYSKCIEVAKWLGGLIDDYVPMGPIILSETPIGKHWKTIVSNNHKALIKQQGRQVKGVKAYIHVKYVDMQQEQLERLIESFSDVAVS